MRRVRRFPLRRKYIVAPITFQISFRLRFHHTLVIIVIKALIFKKWQINRFLEASSYDILLKILKIIVTFHLDHDCRSSGIKLSLHQTLGQLPISFKCFIKMIKHNIKCLQQLIKKKRERSLAHQI